MGRLIPDRVVAGFGALQRDDSGDVVNSSFVPILKSITKQPEGTATSAILSGIGEQTLDNVLGLPENFINQAIGILSPPGKNFERQRGNVQLPSGRDIFAGIDTVFNDKSFLENLGRRNQQAADRPIAQGTGEGLADAGLIFGIRRGAKRAVDQLADRVTGKVSSGLARTAQKQGTFKAAGAEILQTPFLSKVARGIGRSVEAGAEGAALAIVQDGDPIETAGMAAGAQALSSGVLNFSKWVKLPGGIAGPLGSLGATAMVNASLLEALEAIPGFGDDNSFDIDEGFEKAIYGMAIATTLAAMGFARVNPNTRIMSRFPEVFNDALTAIPRGVMISQMEDMVTEVRNGNDLPKQTMRMLAAEPDRIPAPIRRQLDAGLKKGSFVRVVTELSDDLAPLVNVPDPRLAGVPLKEE